MTLFSFIVFGFLQDSFTGVEQVEDHVVQVGYQKGADIAQRNLLFSVRSTEGTAGECACVVRIANKHSSGLTTKPVDLYLHCACTVMLGLC